MHTSDSSESANSSDGFLMSNAIEVETVETAKKIEHAPINFTCLARKKNKFDLNIFDFNYRFGSITLTPTLVQILTSQRRFPNREPVELILWQIQIRSATKMNPVMGG